MNSSGSHEIEMPLTDWRREVDEMEAGFERQATFSLNRINRCFESSDQSLDDDFRQYFLRISNDRLSTTYTKVQMGIQRCRNQQVDGSSDQVQAGGLTHEPLAQIESGFEDVDLVDSRNDGTFDLEINRPENSSGIPSSVQRERSISIDDTVNVKSEVDATHSDTVVEIFDSSDDDNIDEAINTNSREIKVEREEGANVVNVVNGENDVNENQSNASMNRNSDEVHVKEELNIEVKQETVEDEIPIRRFNPNDVSSNGGYSSNNDAGSTLPPKSGKETTRPIDESLAQNQKPSCSKDAKRFKCQHCNYGTDQKGNFNRHMRIHTKERRYQCSRCDKCFTRFSTLKRHMATHKDEFPFHCSGCFCGFSQEIVKKVHETNCRNRRYECFICKYVTINKTLLVRHMRTHSGIKPYRCSRCSKRFATLQRLKLHKTTHKDRKFPFHCKGCFRRFSRNDEKEDHENGCRNRRYECHLCKKFVTTIKTQLEIHMRRHTGEKPFRCEVCLKWFQQKNGLKTHLNTIHSRRT